MLIDRLLNEALDLIQQAQKLKEIPVDKLTDRPNAKSWNVLECLEHISRYHQFYLPEVRQQIKASPYPAARVFRSGWFGNYSANSMLPKKEGKVNMAMKTFPDMDPQGDKVEVAVIGQFIEEMNELVELMERSRAVDLRKTKCNLTIRWLKFTLGDTFRFLINNNRRHFLQIDRILNEIH